MSGMIQNDGTAIDISGVDQLDVKQIGPTEGVG